MDKHTIRPGPDRTCRHRGYAPPHGHRSDNSVPNELRRCPSCGKWWKRDPTLRTIWERVKFFDFESRRLIKEHERRERNQMHTLISSDKIVED